MSSWWSWFWPVNHLLVRSWAHLTTTVHVCGTGFQKTSDTLKENSRSTVSVRLVFELYLYINICFTSWILGFFLYPPSIYGFLVHFKASVLLFYLFSDKKPLISNFTQFKTSAPVFTESCIYNSQGAELNHGKESAQINGWTSWLSHISQPVCIGPLRIQTWRWSTVGMSQVSDVSAPLAQGNAECKMKGQRRRFKC